MSDDGLSMYFKIIGEDTCSLACPVGQYIDAGVDFKCVMCSSECVGCSGSATNCTDDVGCPAGRVFNNATNSCVLACADGLYRDFSTGYCEDCPVGCSLCYGSTTDKCTECTVDPTNASKVFYLTEFDDECVEECGDGYW